MAAMLGWAVAAGLAMLAWWLSSRLQSLGKQKLDATRSQVHEGMALEEFKEKGEKLEATLKGMEEGVLAVDQAGRVLFINPRLETLFGLDASSAVGKPLLSVFRDSTVKLLLEEGLQAGRSLRKECILFVPEERTFSVRVSPLMTGQGQAEGAVVLFLDVTRERQLERLRSEFVANVSHELKTPLTAIRASLETLADGALEDKTVNREFVSKALNHTHRLSSLIEDLLSLSAIEERQRTGMSGASQPGSLEDACQVSFGYVESKYLSRHLKFLPQFPAGLPRVSLDDSSLTQVFTNVLDNAGKYSPEGGEVTVTAEVAEGSVLVKVSDQGPGIPAEDLPRLFERFYRVDRARSREMGGTGLGLSIVKHLVEGAGGQVGVESRLGQGTTFWLKIPFQERPA